MLLHFHQHNAFEGRNKTASKQIARDQVAVDFFRNIFGGGRFRGYIGDISFSELSRAIIDAGTHVKNKEQSATTIDENPHVACGAPEVEESLSGSGCNHHAIVSASGGSDEKIQTAEDARVMVLAETLMERMPLDLGGLIDEEKIKMYHEAEELRSTSFGLKLLYVISTSYHRSSEGGGNGKHGHTHSQKVSNIRSLIQDVRTLEAKLDAVKDEDERRALEEDISGKILLACWRGVRSEVKKVLSRVADYIVTDARVGRDGRKQRLKLLRDVGDVFKHATNDSHGESRDCHLRRIVVDAEDNISKYELLLASRATPRIIPRRQRDILSTEDPPELTMTGKMGTQR
ncbi:hypothetical protein EDD16DRAFT_1624088 [Pisolithus croceorrhizus]|nr:hypothetical protein EDD16DRAFT_1624088 [Pisolithus croceorrhizus]